MNSTFAVSAPDGVRVGGLVARRLAAGVGVLVALGFSLRAQVAPPAAARASSITQLSLEELMDIEVTTVSKHHEKLTSAPAAVFALEADDLQRAGVTSLPDALRLVPGMQVGRVDAHSWAVSTRGFAEVFSNKLLVLRDGRSVYAPLFSGVFWGTQETMLSDLERIEVIRGPGAALWGANAVNGVINILSKPAIETQGGLAEVIVGTDPRFSTSVRYGGAIDKETHYRVYGKFTEHDSSLTLGGGETDDDWRNGQVGFRVDRQRANGTVFTLQGDAYRGREDQDFLVPSSQPPFVMPLGSDSTFDGANLLGRFTRHYANGNELMVQGYFDYSGRDTAIFGEVRRIYDLEVQHRFSAHRQRIIVGAGYRSTSDRINNSAYVSLTPSRRSLDLWNAFAQDDITLGKALHLLIGSKFEHNEFTGFEVQPNVRLLWTPSEQQTVWASVARAVRTPSRSEEDVIFRQITATPGVSLTVIGERNVRSEDLTAYEVGWRFHTAERFSIDAAAFLNRYQSLRTNELTPESLRTLAQLRNPDAVPPVTLPVSLVALTSNGMWGETYGGEVAMAVQLAREWRVRASYSHLQLALHRSAASADLTGEAVEGRSPRDQGYLWSQHDLSPKWKFDWVLRAVSRLSSMNIPGYFALDARLAWQPTTRWDLSITGRDLLDRRHPEFLPTTIATPATETSRSCHLEVRYRF